MTTSLEKTVAFLRGIGLGVHEEKGADGFIPGVEIRGGELFYDPSVPTSNLLHEAGHLAVIPDHYRPTFGTNIEDAMVLMLEDAETRFSLISPEFQAVMQTGDTEATAWAYAAGMAIGLEPDGIIHPSEYEGGGDGVRSMLERGAYLGIHGLFHAGMIEKVAAYPTMVRWLQN